MDAAEAQAKGSVSLCYHQSLVEWRQKHKAVSLSCAAEMLTVGVSRKVVETQAKGNAAPNRRSTLSDPPTCHLFGSVSLLSPAERGCSAPHTPRRRAAPPTPPPARLRWRRFYWVSKRPAEKKRKQSATSTVETQRKNRGAKRNQHTRGKNNTNAKHHHHRRRRRRRQQQQQQQQAAATNNNKQATTNNSNDSAHARPQRGSRNGLMFGAQRKSADSQPPTMWLPCELCTQPGRTI